MPKVTVKKRMLVRHRHGWCAAKNKLDDEAVSDETLCGYVVMFRGGEKMGYPTCTGCRRKMGLKDIPETNVYEVKVTKTIYVTAKSQSEAAKVAEEFYHEDEAEPEFSARPISRGERLSEDVLKSWPWGELRGDIRTLLQDIERES